MTTATDTPNYKGTIEALKRRARRDPYFLRYVDHIKGYLHRQVELPPIVTAGQALGERAGLAMLPLNPDCFLEADLTDFPGNEWDFRIATSLLAMEAQVLLWHTDIFDEAGQIPLPDHVVSPNILPFPVMWWTFEVSRVDKDGRRTDAVLVYGERTGKGLNALVFGADAVDGAAWISATSVRYGAHYPQDFPDGAHSIKRFLAMLAFLNSPYVEGAELRPSRGERREAERLTGVKPGDEASIRVVQLRAAPARDKPDSVRAAGNDRGSDGHWWVRGHMRAQWYSSEQAHHVIWIASHVAGNPEAPLKGKRVYEVKR